MEIRVRQWVEKDTVHDTGNSGVCADAQSQRKKRDSQYRSEGFEPATSSNGLSLGHHRY